MDRIRSMRFQLLAALSCLLPVAFGQSAKPVDQPNPIEAQRMRERQHSLQKLRARSGALESEASLAKTGTDRILVILVEFGGTDIFQFLPTGSSKSTWDPIGKADSSEWTGTLGDCSAIIQKNSIAGPTNYTYTGPLHNQISRPRSPCTRVECKDAAGGIVWSEDFSAQYYRDLIFGNGVKYQYKMQDGSDMNRDLTGISVRSFYQDMSGGPYDIAGEVVGWVQVPHSVWWYGADQCPGRRSGTLSASYSGGIPNAGTARSLVTDAIEAVKRVNPNFDWAQYDVDKDGIIDHLWIVHAGMGEDQNPDVLNNTVPGEGTIWPHAGDLPTPYAVTPSVKAGPYLMVPENATLGVLAHEYGHNLGAADVYATDGVGRPSSGFWTMMADNWTGYPVQAVPPSFDPLHLDLWGWLQPKVISDPYQEYSVTVGQASRTPAGVYRGVKIQLPDQRGQLAVAPGGTLQWWGGAQALTDSMMTSTAPISIPAAGPVTLSLSIAYQLEEAWDFLWVQASADGGGTWTTLTNAHTSCLHNSEWIGGQRGFPNDLCAANAGGFTGASAGYPNRVTESFDMSAFAGRNVTLRFWYMTDWNTTLDGPFVDDIRVEAGGQRVFTDDAEGALPWQYAGAWQLNDGYSGVHSHGYYLQWRNVNETGGFDRGMSDPSWRFGPGNTGLLVWYNNERYSDNNISSHMFDAPSFGPKGRMLVVDSHPEPYRDPGMVGRGFNNEGGNLPGRSLMLDAPFSLTATQSFVREGIAGESRPAVSRFSDATGYYPGAEYVSPGPNEGGQQKWITRQWEASTVVPSRRPYGMRAPGYKAGEELLFNCSADTATGKLACPSRGSGIGAALDGGAGNPGDVGGQYGWNVEVKSQTDTQATLRIWNELSARLVNAGNLAPGPVAPGSFAAFFGPTGASTPTLASEGGALPTTLGGVTVLINDVPAPVRYVDASQAYVQVPYETRPGIATLKVNGISQRFQVVDTAPGIFSIGSRAIAISPSGTYTGTPVAPAPAGGSIIFFVTGQGLLDHDVATGVPTPNAPLMRPRVPVMVTIGGAPAKVDFAGLAPGFPAVMQVNLQVPPGLAPGEHPLVVMQGPFVSSNATISIGPAAGS